MTGIENIIKQYEEDITKYSTNTQLTIRQLRDILKDILDKKPDNGRLPVFHIEFGGMSKSYHIDYDTTCIVIYNY